MKTLRLRAVIKCKQCGKEFEVYPYLKDRAKYCSRDCQNKGTGPLISKARKGHTVSKETREKISRKLKGISVPWKRFSLSKQQLETLYITDRFSTREIGKYLGMTHSAIRYWLKKLGIERRSRSDYKHKEVTLEKIREARMKQKIPTQKTAPELKFLSLCEEYHLPFKYVGDGSFWIGRMNPDFIHNNGRKITVEIFGDYWHDPERREVPFHQTENGRKQLFESYGWKLMVIWEHEVENKKQVLERIGEFLHESS